MEATEAILGLWRSFPDLDRAPVVPAAAHAPAPIGFASCVLRPISLVHAPVPAATVRARVLD